MIAEKDIFGYLDDDPVDIVIREGVSLVGLDHHRLHHPHLCRLLQHGRLSLEGQHCNTVFVKVKVNQLIRFSCK